MNIKINGITLFYEKKGDGTPIILLHGNGEDHHIFDKLSQKLKNDFTIYSIDSRNHGESEKTEDYSYETMAEDVYQFIKVLNVYNVDIIGFSDGAIISLIISMKHEEVINKVALLGVNLKPGDFTDESYQYLKETFEQTRDPLIKLMMEQPNIELNEIKGLSIPTFIIGADNDIYKPETFKKIANTLPNAKLKIMIGHDHDSYISHEDMLYPDLIEFFKAK